MITRDNTTRTPAHGNTILLTDFKTRGWALTAALMTGLLVACESDTPVTGPDRAQAPSAEAISEDTVSADVKARRELEATAAPHWADGYTWADRPTSTSYDPHPSYAFNRSGGAIVITRQGVGQYTVRFTGLSALLGAKSTVKVTGYGSNNDYCKPTTPRLVSDVVAIRCFNANTGAPVDAYYTVLVTRSYPNVAFAHAQLPTSTNYAPQANASWNPAGGPIRVTRIGPGNYIVRFAGLGSRLSGNGGHVQVAHVGPGAPYCVSGYWSSSTDLEVNVGCFSRAGVPIDTKFNLLFVLPNEHLGYAWASEPTAGIYTPSTVHSSNSGRGPIQISRRGTGLYMITWTGLGADLLDGGDVQVTAYGSNAQCKVEGWGIENVNVRCFRANGTLVDAQYNVLFGS